MFIVQVLKILEVVQLQRTEKLNISVQTALADLNIEGANISRLGLIQIKKKNLIPRHKL